MSATVPFLALFDEYMSLGQNRLTSVTKLGGSATLFPRLEEELLTEEQRHQLASWQRCGVCGEKLFLLAQAYAPAPPCAVQPPSCQNSGPLTPSPHHRMLYVWCCNSSGCAQQPRDSWRGCSIQVDREDLEAFGEDVAAEAEEDEEAAYQEEPLPAARLPSHTFPPCHVHVVPEPTGSPAGPTPSSVATTMDPEAIQKLLAKAKGGSTEDVNTVEDLRDLDAQVNLKNSAVDYHFEAFRTRVAREPTQVLRYYPAAASVSHHSEETNMLPLFMNPEKVLPQFISPPEDCAGERSGEVEEGEVSLAEEVEAEALLQLRHRELKQRCRHCGGPLRAELQVMPTALYYLRPAQYLPSKTRQKVVQESKGKGAMDVKKSAEERSVDFATATVYTCANWCLAKEPGVVMEEVFLLLESAPSLEEEKQRQGGDDDKSIQRPKKDLRDWMTSKDT